MRIYIIVLVFISLAGTATAEDYNSFSFDTSLTDGLEAFTNSNLFVNKP